MPATCLIELDSTINEGEINHLRSDLQSAQLDIARLRAALTDTDDPLAAFHPPEGANPALVAMQRQFLVAQVSEHQAKIAALDGQRAQKEAELGTISATVDKLEAVIPTIEERVNIRKALSEYSLSAAILRSAAAIDRKPAGTIGPEKPFEGSAGGGRRHHRDAGPDQGRVSPNTFRRVDRGRAKSRRPCGRSVESRAAHQTSAADRAGVGHGPAVGRTHRRRRRDARAVPGGRSCQATVKLEIEAMVSNRDIGFVHAGDEVEIKVDTFDFTDTDCCMGRC